MPPPPFSWTETVLGLAHPGPLPPPVLRLGVVLLALAGAAIAVLVRLGRAWHGLSHYYFKEWQPGTYLSVLALVGSGVMCWLIARDLGEAPFARFWRVIAVGFVFLGADDLLQIHESADYWIHRALGANPKNPVTRHLDDALVVAYAGVALWFCWRNRAELARLRWTLWILAVAFGLFAAMVLYDVLDWSPTVEESLKLLAGTLIVVGLYAARLDLRGRTG